MDVPATDIHGEDVVIIECPPVTFGLFGDGWTKLTVDMCGGKKDTPTSGEKISARGAAQSQADPPDICAIEVHDIDLITGPERLTIRFQS